MTTIEINKEWSKPYSIEPAQNLRILHVMKPFEIALEDAAHLVQIIEVKKGSESPCIIYINSSEELSNMKHPKILFRTKKDEVFSVSFESWLADG